LLMGRFDEPLPNAGFAIKSFAEFTHNRLFNNVEANHAVNFIKYAGQVLWVRYASLIN